MFKLRNLPFEAEKNAVVSAKTCEYHHGKHHATYVANLNKMTESGEFAGKGLYDIVMNATGGLFNNAAQVYNHDFYWDCIAKVSEPSEALKSALAKNFADFKAEFIAAATAHFGSGWVWLVCDPATKKLSIVATKNADTPARDGLVPLLVVDVWEHAYYIDVCNARPAYLEKFYAGINWEFVSSAYEWALKEGMGSVKFYIDELHGND
ncbi:MULTISPECIES: superoxide dismutase [Fe] [unclassified Campylobacter]|uniref:superoxide dismutase [Fe] n=1 Tax=unclassified Campylobacter TaxID=2593542 RepID=UPI0022EA0817|nr:MULTISPECIES: superoxide dismutase [Fe] [unclassified Campylobacter]MDA3043380.1 superoxide dismutase [Fe] [Campylobacter sp. JMF_09 ED2]MDA3045133.1 superoxide dismutase [Fe] [Campylobacter sp. JMF_07 ED4]MDA3064267.1 superoxide dismutase [Fe] [Campylobacter sp. JMF_11 EL3]MDA3072433.1 superoxide dismutase [Fe] [Campylobacter sp. VBCF_03 NA9]MDA3075455.1 superoxide dismutase [Fe] [Campylobacter sp. JMF_05 ED3]